MKTMGPLWMFVGVLATTALMLLGCANPTGPGLTSSGTAQSKGQAVTTLAGSGSAGSTDGSGSGAAFNAPYGVAVNSSALVGTIYVADTFNSLIRQVAAGGVVTTVAGGAAGTAVNGVGKGASFGGPSGVAVDSAGDIYVADSGDNLIRQVSAGGVVTTLAGSGQRGAANGTGTAASFNVPHGVAVDSLGNIYVADSGNNIIRKITSQGVVTTLAGTGTPGYFDGAAAFAEFDQPSGVAVDIAGNVYVADTGNCQIRKITTLYVNGVLTVQVTTLAGSGLPAYADGTGTGASFFNPFGLAVDSFGNVYVADSGNNMIREITPAGVVTTLAGSGARGSSNGVGAAASFDNPLGVAVDFSGNVYVADAGNSLIREIQ